MNGDMKTPQSDACQGDPEEHVCQICGAGPEGELRPGVLVRPNVGEFIRKDLGSWNEDGWICESELQKYR